MSASHVSRRLRISGRVQGVGFRAFVRHHALSLDLDGFVRNRTDDTVEVLVTGEATQVEALIAFCHEGPPASRVEKIEVSEAQGIVDAGFKQLPTV
jgi:acylphosphatase